MEKINKKFKKVFEQIQIKISRIFAFKARKGLGPLAILLILGVGGIIGVGWALTGKMLGGVEWIAAQVIIGISKILVWLLGALISFLVQTIVNVAQWNKFTTVPAVQAAWGILRDLANMFFILGFLVIAFATVLKSEKYSAKSMLLPLLMMALLVNFSLMICGLVIDFAQVIMLSFVNAFKDIGGGNLIQMLGIGDLLKLEGGIPEGQLAPEAGQVGTLEQAGIYALAALIAFISVVVLAIVAIILILRIVTLWILIILSPLAFIFYVIPSGRSYADMWQKKFVSQVIVGPVLAFFLWFAFYTVQVANEETAKHPEVMEKLKIGEGIFAVTLRPEFYGGFILGCAMLIGALLAAQQIGAVGASLAGKGVNWIKQRGVGTAKFLGKQADIGLLHTTEKLSKLAGTGLEKIGLGGRFAQGLKSFKGVSTFSVVEAYKMRQKMAEARRKEEIMMAAAPQTMLMDKIIDPGQWTKELYNILFGSRKMKRLEAEKEKYDKEAEKKKEDAEKNRKEADELKAAAEALKKAAESLKQKAQEDHDFIKRVEGGATTLEEIKAKLRELGMSQSQINQLTSTQLITQTILGLKQRRDNYKTEAQEKLNLADKELGRADLKVEEAKTLEEQFEAAQKKARELAQKISDIRYKTILKTPRERPWLESLENRRRVAERKKDISLETNNEEQLVIEKLKQGIVEKKADMIQAALEILSEVNGFNTMLMDPFIQSKVKEYIEKQPGYQPGQLEHFEKNPVSPAYLQLAIRQFLEDFASLSSLEAARTAQRIGRVSSLAGNFSFDGMALTNPQLGITKWNELKIEPGKIDIGDKWKEYVKAKFSEVEPQTKNRVMHMDSWVTQGPTGKPIELHLGGKAILETITTADIAQFNRMRTDVIRALSEPHILKQIMDYAEVVASENPEQAEVIRRVAEKLKELRAEREKSKN